MITCCQFGAWSALQNGAQNKENYGSKKIAPFLDEVKGLDLRHFQSLFEARKLSESSIQFQGPYKVVKYSPARI